MTFKKPVPMPIKTVPAKRKKVEGSDLTRIPVVIKAKLIAISFMFPIFFETMTEMGADKAKSSKGSVVNSPAVVPLRDLSGLI